MARSTENIHRFALLTAAAALTLIAVGGLVTSHGAGMSVPDWPTSYGYNMFLFPISQWIGGIFYEHTHRLFASVVGFLTTILAVWLWIKEERSWVRWMGLAAFFAVALQGILGGLRVTLFKSQIGIFHATLAQLFLVLVAGIALVTSRLWLHPPQSLFPSANGFAKAFLFMAVLILSQLILGATMRHQHSGLAIPDFPLAYGRVWPKVDSQTLAAVNQRRNDARDFGIVTPFQIELHMAHRVGALLIFCAGALCAVKTHRTKTLPSGIRALSEGWFGLICLQAILGAFTIWSNKAADIATAHVVTGALILVIASLLSMILFRYASVAGLTASATNSLENDCLALHSTHGNN